MLQSEIVCDLKAQSGSSQNTRPPKNESCKLAIFGVGYTSRFITRLSVGRLKNRLHRWKGRLFVLPMLWSWDFWSERFGFIRRTHRGTSWPTVHCYLNIVHFSLRVCLGSILTLLESQFIFECIIANRVNLGPFVLILWRFWQRTPNNGRWVNEGYFP